MTRDVCARCAVRRLYSPDSGVLMPVDYCPLLRICNWLDGTRHED